MLEISGDSRFLINRDIEWVRICLAGMLDAEVVLEKSGSVNRGNRRFKSFAEMQRSLEETDEDSTPLIYPSPRFGAFYHIPDLDSGFGGNGNYDKHPWVIVTPNELQGPMVMACPRTSSRRQARGAKEILMPGGILTELELDGVIILKIQRPFPIKNFRYYDYIGSLPEVWQDKIRDALQQLAQEKIVRESEAP